MAAQLTKTTKILLVVLSILIIVGVVVVFVIPAIGNSPSQSTVSSVVIVPAQTTENASSLTSTTAKLTQEEEYRQLALDKNFVSIFNNFGYPGADIKEAKLVTQDGSMFYIVLETKDSFDKADDFYNSKKIQSIWSRSEIFETSSQELEELFLNDDAGADVSQTTQGNSQYFKYSFTSESKDQLLNILARSYSQELTQIMIIYWKLSN